MSRPSGASHPLADLRIGVLGKGGSGKSTLAVLLAQTLVKRGYEVVVLDADSTNVGLHQALGIADQPRPLLEYFGGSVFSGGAVTCPVDDPTALPTPVVDLGALPDDYVRRNPEGVRLLVAGKLAELGAGAGCDGPIAKITRDLEVRGLTDRTVVLVDLKAGFEDSARGVLVRLDSVLAVVDPTLTAVRMAAALTHLVNEIHAGALPATRHLADPGLVALANRLYTEPRIRDVAVVLNRIADPESERILRGALDAAGVNVSGVVREDSGLMHAWLMGQALDGRAHEPEMEQIVDRLEARLATHSPSGSARPSRPVEVFSMSGMDRRHELGPSGSCICPKCGAPLPHRRGIRCEEERCPRCAARMLREGSYHHQLWLKKHAREPGAVEAKVTK